MADELRKVFYGIRLAFNGFVAAYRNPTVSHQQSKSLTSLLIVLAIVYIGLLLWFLPAYFVLWVISVLRLMDQSTLDSIRHSISATTLLRALLWFLPLGVLYILRTFLGFESQFFAVLRDTNPKLFDKLESRHPRSWTVALGKFLNRTARVCALSATIQVLRLLPYVGRWVPALWFLQQCFTLLRTSQYLGLKFALVLAFGVFGFVPQGEWFALNALNLQLACMALARELLEPYFTRTIVASDPRRFMIRHGWVLLGFSIPFVLLFAIPVVGLFFAGYANGAAAVALSDLWFADRRNGVDLDTDRRPSLDRLDSVGRLTRPASDGTAAIPADGMDRIPPALDRIDSTDSQSAERRERSGSVGGADSHSYQNSHSLGGGGGGGRNRAESVGESNDLLPPVDTSLDRLDSHDDHSLIRTQSYSRS